MSLQALLKSKGVAAAPPTSAPTSTKELQDLFHFQPQTTAIVMPASLHHHKFKEAPSRPILIERAAKGAVAQVHTVRMKAGNAYTLARPVLKQSSTVSYHAAPIFYGTDRLALRSEADAPPAFGEVQVQALPVVKVNMYKERLYFNAAPLTSFTTPTPDADADADGVSRAVKVFAAHTSFLFKTDKHVKLLSAEATRRLSAPPGPIEAVGGGSQPSLVSAKASTQLSKPMSRVAVLIHADKMAGGHPEAPVVGVRFHDAKSTTMRTALTLTHNGGAVDVSLWATDVHAAYGEGDHAVRAVQLQATPAIFYLKGVTGRDGDNQWEVEQVTPLYAHRADVQAHTVLQSDVLCSRILEALKADVAVDGKNKAGAASELAQRIEYVRTVGALPLQLLVDGFVQDKMTVGLCAEVLQSAGMTVDAALLETLVVYDAECTTAAPRIPEEPSCLTDLFKALFETVEGRTVCALATFAVPSARQVGEAADSDDELGEVVDDDDELGEVVDDDDDEEVLDDDDSSTAEAKVSPGKRRRVHNETPPEEEDDAPLPEPSKRKASA